ncbi:hypothetical protein ABIC16_004258 [Sphingomonas sp. PvP055]
MADSKLICLKTPLSASEGILHYDEYAQAHGQSLDRTDIDHRVQRPSALKLMHL